MNNIYIKRRDTTYCRWGLRDAIKVFLAYMFLMFIGMPIIIQILNVILGFNIMEAIERRGMILFISIFINILILLYVFYIVCIEYRQPVTAMGLSPENAPGNIKLGIKRYLITLPAIMFGGYIVNVISMYLEIEPEIQDVVLWVLKEESLFLLVCLVFFGIIVAPVIEEILFRGFLQPALRKFLGGRYAIIVTAVLFASVHMDAFAFLQIFILGILLGYLYEKTGTLVASVFVHILHNSITLVFLLYCKYFLDEKVPLF